MAYVFQTYSVGEVLTAAKLNQESVNIRDHSHGAAGVATVPAGGIAVGGISAANQFAAGVVGSAALGTGAVIEAKLAASAVASGKLKLATGSKAQAESLSESGAVNQFAFGSPSYTGPATLGSAQGIITLGIGATGTRTWFFISAAAAGTYTWTWDYVTASGKPKMWAVCDVLGNIRSVWEAEDPFDVDNEDANPFGDTTPPLGGHIVQVRWPAKPTLVALLGKAGISLTPEIVDRWQAQCRRRQLAELTTIDDMDDVPDAHRRRWYAQLLLREGAVSKSLPRSLGPLLIQYCRVASDGTLTVKP